MPTVQYPLDLTGSAPTNLIVDEQHTTTEANYRDYRFIVPTFAPFFTTNLVVKLTTIVQGVSNTITLTEGVDYTIAMPYMAATISIGRNLYGGITLNNLLANGIISISYQTIGGTWCADQNHVYEWLAEKAYNPRLILWDQVTNVQEIFPPSPHIQDFDTFYSEFDLIQAIDAIAAAVAGENPNLALHLINMSNPHHVTKEQLGLGDAVVLDTVNSTW